MQLSYICKAIKLRAVGKKPSQLTLPCPKQQCIPLPLRSYSCSDFRKQSLGMVSRTRICRKKRSLELLGIHIFLALSEFLLLALADTRQLQVLHFWLLLGIYLAALLGNGLISTAVACHHRLHSPMYFFLLNLALLDLGCISTTLPKAMANALWDTRDISYAGCAAQVFFLLFFFGAE
uniref:G-protein coupled receptors family 1 profile domain-containing protein n=1 Tax=Meleagris gallopavo TaxID=9103 RepID=H9H1P8_MELGA